MTRLVRKPTGNRADDLARMRAVLAMHDTHADDADLEAAYGEWSSKHTGNPWHPLVYLSDARLWVALRDNLSEEDATCVS